VAVIGVWLPTARVVVENLAVPAASRVAVPSVVDPALNVTEPVGMTPPVTFATVAVRVAAEP
jgi:hypothetical protein